GQKRHGRPVIAVRHFPALAFASMNTSSGQGESPYRRYGSSNDGASPRALAVLRGQQIRCEAGADGIARMKEDVMMSCAVTVMLPCAGCCRFALKRLSLFILRGAFQCLFPFLCSPTKAFPIPSCASSR